MIDAVKEIFNFEDNLLGKSIFLFVPAFIILLSVLFFIKDATFYAFAQNKTTQSVVNKKVVQNKTKSKDNSKEKSYLPKEFSTSVWVPYWARWGGTDELLGNLDRDGNMIYNSNFMSTSTNQNSFYGATSSKMNIDKVQIISPFTFEVNSTGAFVDKGKMDGDAFSTLIKVAKEKKIKIYPTALWIDKQEMEKVLSDEELRGAILEDINLKIDQYGFDGIDLDFEGKSTSTKGDFSDLLKLLSVNLHKRNKGLICTLEVRTPLYVNYEKLTDGTIKNIEYSNDYKVIGEYCDMVRLMTYDQMGADMLLNNKNKDIMYRPVSDITWVKRVIDKAIISGLPKNKIVLGIATYGYKFEVSTNTNYLASTSSLYINRNSKDKWGSILFDNYNIYDYKRMGSMNYSYAEKFAKENSIIPKRNSAGELEYTYSTSTDLSNKDIGKVKTYYVEYSDSVAIKEKVDYAKKTGLAGVAIFKIDGQNDHRLFNMLK